MKIISDFWRYMDTTIPIGVDHDKYIQLKYSNEEQLDKFLEEYNLIDRTLLEKVALNEFLQKSDDEKLRILEQYYVGQKTTQKDNKRDEL